MKSFCKCQFPHKCVNLSFIMTNTKNKLTYFCGISVLQIDFINTFCELVFVGRLRPDLRKTLPGFVQWKARHPEEFDPFIKSQLAASKQLCGLVWCKFGHVPRGIPRVQNPRVH